MRLQSTEICAGLVALLALAGCGSRAQQPPQALPASGKPVAVDQQQEAAPVPAAPQAVQTAAAERHVLVSRARAKRAQQEKLVRRALAVALRTLNAPRAKVKIGSGGSSVQIWLSEREACAVGAKSADRLPGAIGKELGAVKTVDLTVIGSSETPSGFIIDHCRKSNVNPVVKAPAEPPAVLAETGSYFAVTKPFTIHTKRWTLEYSTPAHYFRALVVRGTQQIPIEMAKGGIGKRSFAGPGRFQVRVSSSGKWTIRVLPSR